MRASLKHSRLGIEYWAAESVQGQPDESALMVGHVLRTNLRFGMLLAALVAVAISSLVLEYIRHWVGGAPLSMWRGLGGMVPGVLGLAALFGVSAAFVRAVYGIPSRRAALGYVWLLLFGRAPVSSIDLALWYLARLLSTRGRSPKAAPPFAPYPSVTVREGRIVEKHADTPLARLGGPGNATVFNDSAVFLERFGRFIRVAGPGKIFLRRFERIREVLDLRPHERSETVTALTKDGIPVQTEVQVRFQLARPPDAPFPPEPGVLDPAYKWAWTQAGQSHSLLLNRDAGWRRENDWPERVMGNVGSSMRAIIAGYRLDELLEPYEPNREPRREIAEKLYRELDTAARSFGVQVLEVRLGTLEPTLEEVERERMVIWQALWKSEARKEKARGEAEAIRERGLAQAYAQMEMVLSLTRGFQSMVDSGAAIPSDVVTLRFIESLRQMWSDPASGVFVPLEAMRTLDRLHRMLQP